MIEMKSDRRGKRKRMIRKDMRENRDKWEKMIIRKEREVDKDDNIEKKSGQKMKKSKKRIKKRKGIE